ncbi:tRNA threonylcarbamoyladenosine biosynthesis protein TsaB [Acetoanaerobium noterae]|uniref:tRNA threonylcarbamoyladenosine biosynthesis protein TsaB n=1 Tax=Acetoanaerobium noterae TaxID=745369 RepID=A0A1T5D765_9FIRM|nr:tRNA (adenosine(37)-N6)-threonylcarbamoyltransferase complex dimerization subunit type 1 TsaB [Acetoanaerobium noterae]SKB67525.1 tRNA threonylcarbamoyladenosine biosynthesis protein TsaB [Acetoanaerobium noterae]
MKILGIDTSSSSLSVAVMDDDLLKGEFTLNHKLTHSEQMMPLLDSLLSHLELKMSDIDLIGVSVGPGSFTGIRIGVAAANAMAMALDIPVVGISSLEAMAYTAGETAYTIVSTFDAQRDRFYFNAYRFENSELKALETEDVLEKEDLIKKLESYDKVLLLGDAVFINEELPLNVKKAKRAVRYVRASSVCELAHRDYLLGKTGFAVPVYLRKSQAEIQFEERMSKEVNNG